MDTGIRGRISRCVKEIVAVQNLENPMRTDFWRRRMWISLVAEVVHIAISSFSRAGQPVDGFRETGRETRKMPCGPARA
jgi:hypothetical protein